jgi:hypothetical protein
VACKKGETYLSLYFIPVGYLTDFTDILSHVPSNAVTVYIGPCKMMEIVCGSERVTATGTPFQRNLGTSAS